MAPSQDQDQAEQTGAQLLVFPLARRAGLVRATAHALMAMSSQRAVDRYRGKVADRLFAELAGLGISEYEQDEAVGAFFFEIDLLVDHLLDQNTA